MVDITVAIPTYNGASRLPDVLDRLKAQINTASIRWEVLVVDNNSDDATADVVRAYQADWPQQSPLRYCFAPEQGAAFARQRAVELAHGTFVGFLDDDNWPAADWLAQAFKFGVAHPEVGAFGSQIHGEFEALPPEALQKWVSPYLALIERGAKPHRYEPRSKILPPGAGLVVRRQVWLDRVPKRLFLNNSGKGSGLASEDLEVVLHIQKAGWEIWYNPEMVVRHHIPSARLKKEYLVLLFRCIGLSRFYIRMLGTKSWQRPLLLPAFVANDVRRLAIHLIKYHGAAAADPRIACEREHLVSSLASPVFLMKKALADSYQARRDRAYLPQSEQWMQQLAEAFEQDRFCLYQQPVAALGTATASLTDYELLLRLQPTEQGAALVLPSAFMAVAERYNLMRTLDRWVIRRFLQQQRSNASSALYSINLSQATVLDPNFISFLRGLFDRYGAPQQKLCFEINESVAIAHPDAITQLAHRLKPMGCHLALDNVGLRSAAYSHLSDLPIDYLKLDGSVVKNMLRSNADLQRLTSINQASHRAGIPTIATHVETQTILDKVTTLGVDYAQGHRIAMPQPLATLTSAIPVAVSS